MKRLKRVLRHPVVVGSFSASMLMLALTACGQSYANAHDYNAPTPAKTIVLNWTRLESPGSFPSIIWACFHGSGVYQNQDAGNTTTVLPHDPNCSQPPKNSPLP